MQRNCPEHKLGDRHRRRPACFFARRFFNDLLSFPRVASSRKAFLDFLVSSCLNHSIRPRIVKPATGPRQISWQPTSSIVPTSRIDSSRALRFLGFFLQLEPPHMSILGLTRPPRAIESSLNSDRSLGWDHDSNGEGSIPYTQAIVLCGD